MSPPSTAAPEDGQPPRHVVGIGGSAGSLAALQALLAAMPEDSGMAFVVVTHHPPGKRTLLPEILAEWTALPIKLAEDGERLQSDRVYVVLSDGDWVISGGRLVRREPEGGEAGGGDGHGRVPHAVDSFFRSLAADLGRTAIGIVLSGTGTDGTVGCRAIKSQAGMLMAQLPDSAEFTGMPASAIATHLVDYVLPPEDMPPALVAYAEAEQRREAEGDALATWISEEVFGEILELVSHRTGHDFSGYKRSTLLRRLERRMNVHGIPDPDDYLAYVRRNPAEADLLFKEVIISVTNFFRDPEAWEALASGPLQEQLRAAADEDRTFRAWVVGCATGEEAYTLAILVSECLERLDRPLPVQIFATDVDVEAIEVARSGRYPAGVAEDLSHHRLTKYFVVEDDTYRVTKPIRDMVVFAEHNVLQDPPFTNMDLVTCRNLLIYLERDLQTRLAPLFGYALRPAGVLFLGSSESVDGAADAFEAVDKHWRIYRTVESDNRPRLPEVGLGGRHGLTMMQRSHSSAVDMEVGGDSFTRNVERFLANEFAPPGVLVNDRGEALFFHGRTGRFLEPATGPAQNLLVEMARNGLRPTLTKALREVAGPDHEPVQHTVWVRTQEGNEEVLLEVRPVRFPRALRGLRLVSFQVPGPQEAVPEAAEASEASTEEPTRVRQLERELESARQDKQVTVEELQSSNEELQSMNEELQSMNEELQSSNEELEVSKEEVESLNEELRSVNAELETRVGELSQANDDMKNLLDSTEIATLFLDEDMRITLFTESARKLIALRETDVGRPIDELRTSLRYQALTTDAREVLDTLEPKEVEVQTEDGHWYVLRIRPYRTTENVISGLVCTFRDNEANKRLAASESRFRAAMRAVGAPLLLLDPERRVVLASDGFYSVFPLTPEEVEGRDLAAVGSGQWDDPELRARIEEELPVEGAFAGLELAADFGGDGPGRVRVDGRRLAAEGGEGGEGEGILLTMAATTEVEGE